MEIEKAKQLTELAEQKILQILNDLQKESGCSKTDIYLIHGQNDDKDIILNVHITLSI